MPPKSAVVVPLYIYPLDSQTWSPLYAAIESHPSIHFLIIINPNSGPGEASGPDANYAREIARLNTYPNVCTIGYIRIDYCKTPLNESLGAIDLYASWSGLSGSNLGMHGIFVDETPNHASPERAEYLGALTRYIKASEGILADRFVVHNPGTAPAASLAGLADLVFVCEESYHKYRSVEVQRWLGLNPVDRSKAGFILSGVPVDQVAGLVHELRNRGAYLFLTELVDNFYEGFGDSWGAFMQALQVE